jgi:hypothetical protein
MAVFRNVAIAQIMKAVSTSETSANFYQTTESNIPEDSHLPIRPRENLEPHLGNRVAGIQDTRGVPDLWFEVLTAMSTKMAVLLLVAPCRLV